MIRSLTISAAIAGASAAVSALRGAHVNTTAGCTGNTYDFFLLVTQWPITQCMDVFSCTTSQQDFTMHGLWPNNVDGSYPCTCTNEQFNQNAIASILTQMNTFWPSLNGAAASFWAHEYTKHGTCAEDVLPTELSYFSTALKLRSAYDPLAALATAGYNPSNTQGFSVAEFNAALKAQNGFAAAVSCDSSGNILETQVCIGKNLQPMACPASVTNSCSASTLYIPASMH